MGAHVVGYAGTDNEGLEGLERSLDKKLVGRAGYEVVVRDPNGRAIDVVSSRDERPGKNVVLTLDHQIQAAAEQLLASRVTPVEGEGRDRDRHGHAHRRDPRDGERADVRCEPTSAPRQASARRNRAVTDLYEPGSTFKIVTIAAALEDNVVSPLTSFWLQPTIQVADRVIHEAHIRGTEIDDGAADPGRVVERRDDHHRRDVSGAASLRRGSIGSDSASRPESTIRARAPGIVLPYEKWSGSTIGTVPIGQGIAVTPAPDGERVRGDRRRRDPAASRIWSRRSAASASSTRTGAASSRRAPPSG